MVALTSFFVGKVDPELRDGLRGGGLLLGSQAFAALQPPEGCAVGRHFARVEVIADSGRRYKAQRATLKCPDSRALGLSRPLPAFTANSGEEIFVAVERASWLLSLRVWMAGGLLSGIGALLFVSRWERREAERAELASRFVDKNPVLSSQRTAATAIPGLRAQAMLSSWEGRCA